jgi:hypothetical protein
VIVVTDDERVARATRRGLFMHGPKERGRCQFHKRRWIIFRWVWHVDSDISGADTFVERSCADCLAEELASD